MNDNRESSSNRRLLARLGESTHNMLSFQDMTTENSSIVPKTMERIQLPNRPHMRERAETGFHQPSKFSPNKIRRTEASSHKKSQLTIAPPREICLPPLGGERGHNNNDDTVIPPCPHTAIRCCYTDPVVVDMAPPSTPRHGDEPMWTRTLVNILPGIAIEMAGTHETMHALHHNQYKDTTCIQCQNFLYCIDTASMVLCPQCRSISPVSNTTTISTPTLGLGLTFEHILEARMMDQTT